MDTQNDDFPYTSDDPSLTPIEDKNAVLPLTTQQLGDIKSTLRLVIGSTLTGTDVYTKRLRRMQATQHSNKPETIIVDENETARDQLRYLLLGVLFETPDILQRGMEHAEKASSRVFNLFSRMLSPFTNSWVFSPVKGQYSAAADRGEKIINRLIMKGRIEEQNSRNMIQEENVNALLNEVVEYVLLKTEIRRLIQEEGLTVASDVTGEFQEQSATVDSILEQKLKSIFHKGVSTPSSTTSNTSGEGE